MKRKAKITRKTKETKIDVEINVDGKGKYNIKTGIGSGGNYALASAKVLMDTDLSAEEVAKKAIKVASEICVCTNNNIKIEKI